MFGGPAALRLNRRVPPPSSAPPPPPAGSVKHVLMRETEFYWELHFVYWGTTPWTPPPLFLK